MSNRKITRREAIKYMGTTLAGLALTPSAMSVFTSCTEENGHLAPQMVQEFVRKATLKARYLFAILTCGNRKCSVTELWNNLALSNGVHFNYITTMKMVDNFLPSFDMNEQMKIDKQEDR